MYQEPAKTELRTLAQQAVLTSPITRCRTGARTIRGNWDERIMRTKEELGIGQPRPAPVVPPVPVAQPAPAQNPELYQLALLLRKAGII